MEFSIEKMVSEGDIDTLNHVNNVKYLDWVLEIAEKHWAILSNDSINERYVWVVLSHHLEYKKACFLGEKLLIKTFIVHSEGFKSERRVEIFKDNDKNPAFLSSTIWCLLDKKAMKPTRITEELKNLMQ